MKYFNLVKIFIILQFIIQENLTLSEHEAMFSKYSYQLKGGESLKIFLRSVLEWFVRNEIKLAFMNNESLRHEYDRFIASQSSSHHISKENQQKVFTLLEKFQKERINLAMKKLSEKDIVKKVVKNMINKNPSRFGK